MQPSIHFFIGFLVVLNASAWLLDRILSEAAVVEWRKKVDAWWGVPDKNKWLLFLENSSIQFCWLFDAIYGASWFSLKRVIRSVLSSLFAVTVVLLLVGPESNFLFGEVQGASGKPIEVSLVFKLMSILVLNVAVDFVSLQETRWVLGLAAYSKIRPISLLFLVDLLLTTFLFIVFWYLLAEIGILLGLFGTIKIEPTDISTIFHYLVTTGTDLSTGGIYFASTFFTSFLWFGFIVFAGLLKLGELVSPTVRLILRKVSDTDRPARLLAGFLSSTFVLVYLVAFGVYKL